MNFEVAVQEYLAEEHLAQYHCNEVMNNMREEFNDGK